jgi:hypothetical protein
VIFNKQAMAEFKAHQSKRRRDRVIVLVGLGLAFHFLGAAQAVLLGVAMAVYALSEIDATLSYANFLKAHELGLHNRFDE